MGITNLLSSLGGTLYELPKKVMSYATLPELHINPDSCADIGNAKISIGAYARNLDGDAQTMHTVERMQEYAVNAFDRMESFFQLKHYLTTCGVDTNTVYSLSDKGQQLVDTAYQMYQEGGIKVPFTGEPMLMAMMAGGIMAGVYAYTRFRGKSNGLFYNK